jgi:hypothetical protein
VSQAIFLVSQGHFLVSFAYFFLLFFGFFCVFLREIWSESEIFAEQDANKENLGELGLSS